MALVRAGEGESRGAIVKCGRDERARRNPQWQEAATDQLAAVTAKIVWPSRTYVEPGRAFAARLPTAASSASAA